MTTVELKSKDREVELSVDKHIFDEDTKKRLYVAELIKKALNDYLDYDNLKADNTYSLYKLPIINEKLDIIDFEINSLSVHVIPTIDKAKNQNVYIPKSYKTYHCKPDIIIFVNFTKSFMKMNILGFITDFNLNSLAIPVSSLISPNELINALKKLSPRRVNAPENAIKASKELMLAYIDSSLSEEGEQFFLKNLISSKEIRKNYKLFYALNCKFIAVAKRHTSLSDDNFVAADSIPEEEYIDDSKSIMDLTSLSENDSETISEPVQDEDITEITTSNVSVGVDNFEEDNNLDDIDNIENTFDNLEEQSSDIELEDIDDASEEMPVLIEDNTNELIDLQTEESDTSGDNFDFGESDTTMQGDVEPENISSEELPELDFSSLDNDESFDLNDDGGEISLEEAEEEPQQVSIITEKYPTQSAIIQEERHTPLVAEEYDDAPKQEDIENNAMSESINGSDEDVFSFLSEMADESQQQIQLETNQSSDENAAPLVQEEAYINEPVANEEPVNTVEEEIQENEEIQEIENNAESMLNANNFNDAFAPQNTQPQETAVEYTSQIPATAQPTKSSSRAAALLLAVLAIGGIGAGVYFNKDKIPFLNASSEIQGLEQTDSNNNVAELPPPIANTPSATNPEATDANAPAAPGAPTVPTPPTPTAEAAAAPATPQAVPTKEPTTAEQNLPSLPKAVEPPKPKHLNDAIATALTNDFAGVRISKVSWEVSETLVNNQDVKRYLTIAGKSIKNSLSQDLMAATEPSFKDTVVVDITYKKDGAISQVKIASSSGSSQIDEIIVKSVKDTLNYVRMPSLNLNKPEYTAKLIVRL